MRSPHVQIATCRRAGVRPRWPNLSTWSERTGSLTTVRVAGEVDLVTAPALREALESAQARVRTSCAHPELLIDLHEVSFLGAAGLHVLDVVHIRCVADGMSMRVVADQPAVRRPMALTGLERLLAG